MIDLHIHILPELDDGSQSLEESLEMARMAVDSGVTDMAVTPHSYADRHFYKNIYDTVFTNFKNELKKNDINLNIYKGMEILAFPDMIDFLKSGDLKTINKTRYALVEFDFGEDAWMIKNYLNEMLKSGYIPIVAHLERYAAVQRNLKLAFDLNMMGCVLQINKGSLKGRFGKNAMKTVWKLLEYNLVHIMASDAHSCEYRTPYMLDAVEIISDRFSEELAELITEENPKRILEDEPTMGFTPVNPDKKNRWFF